MDKKETENKIAIDPNSAICVIKHNGREVGRIAATAANASEYMQTLALTYNGITVDYEENKDAAMISRMLSGGWQC